MLINKFVLAGVAKCAAREQGRFAINGVMLNSEGLLVATDGRKLAVHKLDVPQESVDPSHRESILSMDTISAAVELTKGQPPEVEVTFVEREELRDGQSVLVRDAKLVAGTKCAQNPLNEGLFPKWQQVMPKDTNVHLKVGLEHLQDIINMAKSINKAICNTGLILDLHLTIPFGEVQDNAKAGSCGEVQVARPIGFSCNEGLTVGVLMPVGFDRDEKHLGYREKVEGLFKPSEKQKAAEREEAYVHAAEREVAPQAQPDDPMNRSRWNVPESVGQPEEQEFAPVVPVDASDAPDDAAAPPFQDEVTQERQRQDAAQRAEIEKLKAQIEANAKELQRQSLQHNRLTRLTRR